ncbi:MAG: hypothetical protein GKR93_12305 [Gammaproteobacteria bacterium]|nr:hypothetical protein [Gammaproteobacteria bacterium]
MRWIHLEGGYFDIGYQLGWWWGKTFKRQQTTGSAQAFLNALKKPYQDCLNRGWDDAIYPLLQNTIKYFPEVMEEIAGIAQGATDAGFATSIPSIFALCLEENDIQKHHCSAALVKQDNGFVLGHNEENDRRYPLCYAKVSLRTKSLQRSFVSISYPFELLASSAGMTRYFAFQNNSIGHAGYEELLENTWQRRVPKAVILRKLLDLTSLKEIKQLYSNYHLALPYHQYLCFADKAYSIEVRPLLNPYKLPKNQVKINEMNKDSHIHTNHFIRNIQIDMNWIWSVEADLLDTQARKLQLRNLLQQNPSLNKKNVKTALLKLARNPIYRDYTSATLIFNIQRNKRSCNAVSYFNDRINHLDEIVITKS